MEYTERCAVHTHTFLYIQKVNTEYSGNKIYLKKLEKNGKN